MTAVEKLISVAKAEIGYKEKATNSQLDDPSANAGSGNFTKYARDLDNIAGFYNGAKNGYAWCDVFVDWCFTKAFGAAKAKVMLCQPDSSAGAGCTYSLGYYKNCGLFHRQNPQVGDQIFFGSESLSTHTGIVIAVSGYYVTTIEGNCGDSVKQMQYCTSNAGIAGYGTPKWSVADGNYTATVSTAATVTVSSSTSSSKSSYVQKCSVFGIPLLKKSSIDENSLVTLQILLKYKYGKNIEVDGIWGDETEKALKSFQSSHSLLSDGECGTNSWYKLITAKRS